MLTRLFGNKKLDRKIGGSIEENGVGKFNDINAKALAGLAELGITHIWYTGVIEHATTTDYSADGIASDHPDIVKGRAGSPYAIKDYYDVAPDLAVNVADRMAEFEALIARTHKAGIKVLMDFVANHVSRSYRSDAKPDHVADLGENDDASKGFAIHNNFYYLPGQRFVVPRNHESSYYEFPAKVTGNDCFSPTPSDYDWFETVKLNYGVDYLGGFKRNFDPIPSTWVKMKDILLFWAGKGVDGFRCDMAEMTPVEFWNWAIPQVKSAFPHVIFIAELYTPENYDRYTTDSGFDYLYDKTGIYDIIRDVIQNNNKIQGIIHYVKSRPYLEMKMLRFLENHDEHRLASHLFAGDAFKGVPAMTALTTLHQGPVMIYFGQEVGEKAKGVEGYSSDDGRTTIFDYWAVEEHQKWMNGGKFDGGLLSDDQKRLRSFYQKLFTFARKSTALDKGKLLFLDVHELGNSDAPSHKVLAFVRYDNEQKLLIICNFDDAYHLIRLTISPAQVKEIGLPTTAVIQLKDHLNENTSFQVDMSSIGTAGLQLKLSASAAMILEF